MEIQSERQILCKLANLMKHDSDILDLGCGPGNVISFLSSIKGNTQIDAIDLSNQMLDIAKENLPHINCIREDVRNIDKLEKKYDVVIASFIVVHLNNDETKHLIRVISQTLKPNGLLYMSFIKGVKQGFEVTSFSLGNLIFYNYYEEKFILHELAKNKLQLFDISKKEYIKSNNTSIMHVYLIAQKEEEFI